MSCSDQDKELQDEEIGVLCSIYGDEWTTIDDESRVYSMLITDGQEPAKLTLTLKVILLENYPSESPPLFELRAPWLNHDIHVDLSTQLQDIYLESPGEVVLFRWIEHLKEYLANISLPSSALEEKTDSTSNADGASATAEPKVVEEPQSSEVSQSTAVPRAIECVKTEICPEIHHGETVTDRKSVFQPHLAKVVSLNEVKAVCAQLVSNRKIASATHNIVAFRIFDESRGLCIQDCDDDGETAAGSRMLHLMQILDVKNVVVIVTRWYGGVHLGPDRFKHINNCARTILVDCGFVPEKDDSSKSSRGKKGKASKKK